MAVSQHHQHPPDLTVKPSAPDPPDLPSLHLYKVPRELRYTWRFEKPISRLSGRLLSIPTTTVIHQPLSASDPDVHQPLTTSSLFWSHPNPSLPNYYS